MIAYSLRALLLVFTLFIIATNGQAAVTKQAFDETVFAQLQEDGAAILVDVKATWCSTCAKQKKILEAYAKARPDSKLVILEVDFDDQKDLVKRFKAPRQSTLVLFSGKERRWFSVAETRKDKIFAALDQVSVTKK